jgi:hypothetical protein
MSTLEIRLLFANRRDIRLLESNPTSSSPPSRSHGPPTTIKTVIPNLTDVTSLDWVDSTICWTDIEEGAIYCQEGGIKVTDLDIKFRLHFEFE